MKALVKLLCFYGVCFLVGCGNPPTYQLNIGKKTVDLTVHKDAKDIQDDLIAELKSVWDELESGDSVFFSYRRTMPLDLGPELEGEFKALEKKSNGKLEVSNTQTNTSPQWRFFKGRNGMNGVEQVDDDAESHLISNGEAVYWKEIESRLRAGIFSERNIRWFIKNDYRQQNSSAGAGH